MSVMTQFVREGKRYTNYVYLSLARTNKLPSLFYHLEQEKNINHILIVFDNDDAGITAGEAVIAGLNNMGYKGIVEIFAPPSGKD
ncbi:toprim domain-containing protein [bacterium]|nr:toprim domain-containing protein [bacterium]